MLGILAVFGATFLTSLSGALMPGPLFTYTVRESLRRGFVAGPAVSAGHILVELALVVALGLGLSRFLEHSGPLTAAIAFAGGAFLLWMGYTMVRNAAGASLEVEAAAAAAEDVPARPAYRARLMAAVAGNDLAVAARPSEAVTLLAPAGVLISITNPYWSIWWATIGMGLLAKGLDHGVPGVTSFFTAHALSDLLWLSFVAFVLASGRRMVSARAYHGLLVTCGLGLLLLGGWFIYSGVSFLV